MLCPSNPYHTKGPFSLVTKTPSQSAYTQLPLLKFTPPNVTPNSGSLTPGSLLLDGTGFVPMAKIGILTTIFFSLCRERTVPSRCFCVRVLMLTRTRTRIRTVTREREWEGGALKVGRYMCACVYGRLCERSTPAIDGLLQKVTRFSLNIPFRFRLRVCTRRFRSRLRSK